MIGMIFTPMTPDENILYFYDTWYHMVWHDSRYRKCGTRSVQRSAINTMAAAKHSNTRSRNSGNQRYTKEQPAYTARLQLERRRETRGAKYGLNEHARYCTVPTGYPLGENLHQLFHPLCTRPTREDSYNRWAFGKTQVYYP